jgi:hypothetical protein
MDTKEIREKNEFFAELEKDHQGVFSESEKQFLYDAAMVLKYVDGKTEGYDYKVSPDYYIPEAIEIFKIAKDHFTPTT